MVRTDDNGHWWLIRQVDHQVQCGVMAEAWGNEAFQRLSRWDSVITAAATHDEGWRDEDEYPHTDTLGRPVDFPDLDRTRHTAFYTCAIEDIARDDPAAGLVVCLHGRGLYEKRLGLDGTPPRREGRPEVERTFIENAEARQRQLEMQLGNDAAAWGWDGFRLLQAWDVLSLYLIWIGLPMGATWTLPKVPRAPGDTGISVTVSPVGADTGAVSPWPFAGDRLDLPVAARRIPQSHYTDDSLRDVLAQAPWEQRDVRLIPGDDDGRNGVFPPRHAT